MSPDPTTGRSTAPPTAPPAEGGQTSTASPVPPHHHPHPGPSLIELAEIVHRSTAHRGTDSVVVTAVDRGTVDLGIWPLPADLGHPTDALIGWRPPTWAHQVGLVTAGRTVALGAPASRAAHPPGDRARITVLLDQQGCAATVFERAAADLELLTESPEGWVADALRRTLGLPTTPPVEGLGICVEAGWIAAIAHALWRDEPERSCSTVHAGRPAPALTWAQVALLHPLHPHGPVASPARLASATAQLDAESSWERMLAMVDQTPTAEASHPPPQPHGGPVRAPVGSSVPLSTWFDAGSFARWTLRNQPPPGDLLYDVLDQLAEPVADQVIDALVALP
jgi:hypothetical protein